MADNFTTGFEDVPIEPPTQARAVSVACPCCCACSYRRPTLRELWERDRRFLRAILVIAVVLNAPIGRYVLYPFMLFSTWIHELFHGLAAISVGGKVAWLNIYPDGSGLASTSVPDTILFRAWVASAGYQGTALVGGIMLMFRRTNAGTRVGTCGIGLTMLVTCLFFVRNLFGLVVLGAMGGLLMITGWRLPLFWVGELYALLAATTCLNAITSIQVLFFASEATIGGEVRSTDAATMQSITKLPALAWASLWMALAFWMTAIGVFVTFEAKNGSNSAQSKAECQEEEHPLALTAELA